MTELPRTEDLPRSEEGYDAARVEEAFSSFADRVRELESVAGELRSELRALRSERVGQRAPAPPPRAFESESWPAEPGSVPAPDWIAAVPPPLLRPLTVPRLVLEGIFLLLVALFAGLADLSTTSIVLLMAAAWSLVALSEWAAAAKRARWRLGDVAPPVEEAGAASDSTGPWSMPVVHATVVEAPDHSESHTVVAKLPPAPEEAEPEPEPAPAAEAEPEPDDEDEPAADAPDLPGEPEPAVGETTEEKPPRRGFLRRRRPVEAPPADPWEA